MKFQDEGPKLRQHFEKSAHKSADDDILNPEQTWLEASSSSSSGASSSSSPDADPVDVAALQVAMRGQPAMFAMFENLELSAQDRERWSAFQNPRASPLIESRGCSTLTEESLLNFFGLRPFQWVPSPVTQQQQLLYTFTSSMNSTTTRELHPALRNHGNWLARLPPLSGTNPLLDNAIRACTLAHLGRRNQAEHVMRESQVYYGKALRLLSGALQDTQKGMSSETLSATILLSFYEIFVSDSDQSWVRHAGGASTLMKMRGPARHRTGFDREIFLAYRHALVIQAFEVQTPCFLDEPEWRQLSRDIYEDRCASGVVGDKLDVFEASESFFLEMVQLPKLMCDAGNMAQLASTTNSDIKTAARNLSDRATNHRANLKSAYMRLRAALKRLGHEPSSRMSGDPLFPVRYDYTNVFTGGMFTGYWTVLIMVNAILKELDPSPARCAMYQFENSEAAREICKSAAWMSTSSFQGPFLLTFGLRMGLLAFEDEAERRWIFAQLEELGATRISMAKDVPFRDAHPDMGLPKVRNALQEDQTFAGYEINKGPCAKVRTLGQTSPI
jgi:Fungal specific transcription factor domain